MIFTFGRLRYIRYDFQHCHVSIMAKCGFSKFVGDSCGHGTSSADTQCIILAECKKDIKPHLRGFNVIDSSLKSEMQLIFDSPEQVLHLMHFAKCICI